MDRRILAILNVLFQQPEWSKEQHKNLVRIADLWLRFKLKAF
jgi:hypothetical protein